MTPPISTGSRIANGFSAPVRPTLMPMSSSFVVRVVAGNLNATAQRGSRPTAPSAPLHRERVDLHDDAVDLVRQRRALLAHPPALGEHAVDRVVDARQRVDREPALAQPVERRVVRVELDALERADRVAPERQRALRRDFAGSSCRSEPAAVLRGFMYTGSPCSARSSLSRAKAAVGRYTSPRTSTSAGGDGSSITSGSTRTVRRFAVTSSPTSPLPRVAPSVKRAVAVDQGDREPVDLGLGDVARLVGHAGRRQQAADALVPGLQLVLVARVRERQHRLQVAHLDEALAQPADDPLGGRVGRDEVRVRLLERAQLAQQRVVGRVVDGRVVVDEVARGRGGGSRPAAPRSASRRRSRRTNQDRGQLLRRLRHLVGAGVPQHGAGGDAPGDADRAAAGGARPPRCRTARRPRTRASAGAAPSRAIAVSTGSGSGLWRSVSSTVDDRAERDRRRLDREGQVDRVARLRRRDADRRRRPRAARAARRRRRRSGRSSAAVLAWFQTR